MRTLMLMPTTKGRAFTLVELLVVIGIIALLISILLPSLNKARQQTSLLDCQARLRTMGQALNIYNTEYKGALPWGVVDHGAAWTDTAPFTPSTSNQEQYEWWMFTLSQVMNRNARDAQGFARVSPIFRDRDTIEVADARYVNHYTANPRVLYQANAYDSAPAIFSNGTLFAEPAAQRKQRKMGTIKKTSNIFVIWDGPQFVDQQYNAYPLTSAIDSWGMDNTTGLCFDAPYSGNQYGKAILPAPNTGFSGVSDGKLKQKERNADFTQAFQWEGSMRFRHVGNSTLAALCLGGHIETCKVGTVIRGDIFTNYK
jgi:prepilin-type N-terminal cleavage/methylation domain-containing protein